MASLNKTDITKILTELDGGVLEQKINRVLSDTALGVIENGKKGSVSITFNIEQIGKTTQVMVKHKLDYSCPTNRGKRGEEDTTTTPMHVGPNGTISVFPDHQQDLFNAKSTEDTE